MQMQAKQVFRPITSRGLMIGAEMLQRRAAKWAEECRRARARQNRGILIGSGLVLTGLLGLIWVWMSGT